MEWSRVSLLMTDHTHCPQPFLAKEGFFLGPPLGWLWSDFISSLANTDPYESVFPVLRLVRVLWLGPWLNIYIDMGSLAFYPHNYIYTAPHQNSLFCLPSLCYFDSFVFTNSSSSSLKVSFTWIFLCSYFYFSYFFSLILCFCIFFFHIFTFITHVFV